MADDAQTPFSSNPYPDNGNTVRSISWREVFPFLHIFRSFRIAIHPSKLVLGLLALLSLYAGGRILDGRLARDPIKANFDEAAQYEQYTTTEAQPSGTFQDQIDARRRQMQQDYASVVTGDQKSSLRRSPLWPMQVPPSLIERVNCARRSSTSGTLRSPAPTRPGSGIQEGGRTYQLTMNGNDAAPGMPRR